ncbi:MAG: ligase-associated DNA damage response endonuclease PdeM [Pseudomonadota bacterium]
MHHAFSLGPATLQALPSGALHWPAEQLLCVSDLHFGKSERMARRGGALLPPYDTRATLGKLDADMERTRATRVICLGDSFDDMAASEELDEADRLWLARLMAGRHWIWVEGNHDPGPLDIGGSHKAEVLIGDLTFRHIANPSQSFEISGHYHPKARLASQSRPCFLADAARVILPAYGTYTGGLWADDPALTALMRPDALAIVTGQRALCIPMPRQV